VIRESLAELVNRIQYLKEANTRLEARVRLLTEETEKAKTRHADYRTLVIKLRDDTQSTIANWAFKSIEDFHLKANAALAVEKLLGDIAVAQHDLADERKMFDWLSQHLGNACIEEDGTQVELVLHMDNGVVDIPQSWRMAITKHLESKAKNEHLRET
jgi:hypothetical protein